MPICRNIPRILKSCKRPVHDYMEPTLLPTIWRKNAYRVDKARWFPWSRRRFWMVDWLDGGHCAIVFFQKYGFTLGENKSPQTTIFRQQVLRVRKPVQQQQTEVLTVAEEPVSPSGMLPRVISFFYILPQSRQSDKLFLQSSEFGLPPNPSPAGECAPPPVLGGGAHSTLAGKRGVGRVPIPTRGHTLWYSLYIRVRTLWVLL
jgi:hypothetical protein